MKKFMQQTNRNSGFTLIETLVAVTIFTIALVAIVHVSGRGISDMTITKNKLLASNLAQEGIEGVRALRDGFLIDQTLNPDSNSTTVGFTGFVKAFLTDNPICKVRCGFDPRERNLKDLNASVAFFSCEDSPSLCNIYVDSNGVYYSSPVASTGETVFRRTIKLAFVNKDEVKVISHVEWKMHGQLNIIELTENLFDFIPPQAEVIN